MSRSSMVLENIWILHVFGIEANGAGFSVKFFGFQSAEMFCFARKKKIKCQQLLARTWHFSGSLFFNPYDFTTYLPRLVNVAIERPLREHSLE